MSVVVLLYFEPCAGSGSCLVG